MKKQRVHIITRHIEERLISFTCQVCAKEVEEYRLPCPTPKYCSENCRKQANAARKRELRAATGKNKGKRGRPRKSE